MNENIEVLDLHNEIKNGYQKRREFILEMQNAVLLHSGIDNQKYYEFIGRNGTGPE